MQKTSVGVNEEGCCPDAGASNVSVADDGVIKMRSVRVSLGHGEALYVESEVSKKEGGGFLAKTTATIFRDGQDLETRVSEEEFDELPENVKQALDDLGQGSEEAPASASA